MRYSMILASLALTTLAAPVPVAEVKFLLFVAFHTTNGHIRSSLSNADISLIMLRQSSRT